MRPIRILGPFILALPLSAQMHHVDKPERVTRAVGVYEWTGDMAKPDAARLIPVSIFINNRYEDAGVYLAKPIPLAVETGNVYAVQRAGDIIGNVDLDFARNIIDKRTGDDNPLGAWYGYGRFIPLSAAPPPAKLTQHSATPASIVGSDDDSRPSFVKPRHPSDDNSTTTTTVKNSSPSTTPAPADDPDRPHMNRRDSGSSTSGSSTTDNAPISSGTNSQGTATQDPGTVPDDDPDRPTLGRRNVPDNKKQKKQSDSGSGVEAMPTSLNADPDRPQIHRGKVESATAPPQLNGTPANLHQAIAVSDAANNPIHVFARDWDSIIERAQTITEMEKLAQPLVHQYLTANHLEAAPVAAPKSTASAPVASSKPASSGPKLNTAPATAAKAATTTHSTTAHTTSTHHTAAATPAPLTFQDEQIAGYTLSYGGLPTFVYSAALVTTVGPPVRVTIVAQRLPSGELQTSLSSVTDEGHLDRIPWMRLVDAVDPDDSHRASLLFELRAKNSRQFALYSLASAEAQQTFVTGVIE
jgi:hypothetical protein